MRILIIADPLESLKPLGDTGLAFLHESVSRGHESYWCTPKDIFLEAGRVLGQVLPVKTTESGVLPRTASPVVLPLLELDVILIRKDPPFDDKYVSLCWILSSLENNVIISNKASLLLSHHEKWVPMMARRAKAISDEDWIPPHVFFSKETFELWFHQMKTQTAEDDTRWILKPWRGYAGHSVQRAENNNELFEKVSALKDIDVGWIVQSYHQKVEETGDRRVFVLNGKVRGSFVRRAQPGDFVTNMAQGGYVEFCPMTPVEEAVCERAALYLHAQGIEFAGLDIVDSRLNEINVTAPTGVRVLKAETGIDIAQEYIASLEARVNG